MASFQNVVITTKGQALMAKMIAGTGNIQFTKISTSSTVYTAAQLEGLTALTNIKQTTLVSKVTRTNNTAIKIEGAINNAALAAGYSCATVGVYALDPQDGEILYGVTITSQTDYIPAFNNVTSTGIKFELVISVGNAANVTLTVNPAAVATVGDLDAVYSQIANIEAYVGYTADDIFGIEADFKNKKFTRLAGALNRTAGAMFDGIECFGGRKRCVVTDGGIILAYYGETGFTESGALTVAVTKDSVTYPVGTVVQVMVYQPKFYYKVVPLSLEKVADGKGFHMRKARYYVCPTKREGFKLHPAFIKNGVQKNYVLIGAYEGCLQQGSNFILNDAQTANFTSGTGDKLASIANAKPISGLTQNLTRRNCGILAENRGAGWSQEYGQITALTQLLMVIEFGGFNVQNLIGRGNVDNTDDGATNMAIVTGGTSTLGNATGNATGASGKASVSYRGEENPWGNIWMFVDGLLIRPQGENSLFVKDNAFTESGDGYADAGITIAKANGYISAMAYNEPFDWLFFPSEVLGDSNLPVGDYLYQNYTSTTGFFIALMGATWLYGSNAGGVLLGCE